MSEFDFDFDLSEEFDTEMEIEDTGGGDDPVTEDTAVPTPTETLPGFDELSGQTWIFPSNLSRREYQFEIVKSCLYKNTLVCLPTGLGKTFIAAVVMYNFYRWYPTGKIIFMAPTKPLVNQQIESCFKVMGGISQSDFKELTGNVGLRERASAWSDRRVFFVTPQVLTNDMCRGLLSVKHIRLLVVDEAHRAQGDYPYCQIVKDVMRGGAMTRIIALSATPGTDIPKVKTMIQNLCISHIELRHEESPDILPYTHERKVDKIVVKMDEDMVLIKQKLLSVIEIYTKKLSLVGAIRSGHNPSKYNKIILLKLRDEFRQNPPDGISKYQSGKAEGDFATGIKLYVCLERLENQGLRGFYRLISREPEEPYAKRMKAELERIPMWRDILATLAEKFADDSSNSILSSSSVLSEEISSKWGQKLAASHPKMEKLMEIVKKHFEVYAKIGETRVIIFTEFRDCVTELVACLSGLKPRVKPMPFVGQAGAGGKRGLTQRQQIEAVRKFKEGGFNTLVATCVAEEGLDIGEVDLIVLYDVASSPIRLVQRMGRTGRKRDGKIIVLVTEGAEERSYDQTMFTKKSIHKALMEKDKLEDVMFTNAPRMIPVGLEPQCRVMKLVEGKWEPKQPGNKSRFLNINYFRAKTKLDIVKISRGFLTEAEREEYKKKEKFTGKKMSLNEPREVWSEEKKSNLEILLEYDARDPFKYDLGEFLLWQVDNQNRKYVDCSSLSKVMSDALQTGQRTQDIERITKLRANSGDRSNVEPKFVRKRKVVGVLEDGEINTKQRKISGDEKEKTKVGRARKSSGDEKERTKIGRARKYSGEMNSITNYFRPSQNKSQSESGQKALAKEICAPEKMKVIEEESDDEPMQLKPVSPLCFTIQPNDNNFSDGVDNLMKKVSEPAEFEKKTEELLHLDHAVVSEEIDGEDSGVYSVHSPPDTNKVQERYTKSGHIAVKILNCSMKMNRGKTTMGIAEEVPSQKHEILNVQNEVNTQQSLAVFPATVKNDSDEDMFNDSDFEDIEFSKIEREIFSGKKNDEKEAKDSAAKESNFDLGSPILEVDSDEQNTNEDICKGKGDFLDMDMEDKIDFDLPLKGTKTSTPLIMKAKDRQGSLRKSVLSKKLEIEPEKKTNISEDMFDNSDDDLDFDNMNFGQDDDEKVDTSLYSTTELLKMINETPEKYAMLKRKKLSPIFSDTVNGKKEETSKSEEKNPSPNSSVDIFEGEAPFDFGSQDFMIEEQPEATKGKGVAKREPSPDPGEGPSWRFGNVQHEGNSNRISNEKFEKSKKKDVPDPGEGTSEQFPNQQTCMVCNEIVPGDLKAFNEHLDLCLNASTIKELTQQDFTQNNTSYLNDILDRSNETPPSSPIVRKSRKTNYVLASQSFEATQRRVDQDIYDDPPPSPVKHKSKKKASGKMFIDFEADLSGDDHSEDEKDQGEEHYDESFVDDLSQETDHSLYLRSVKSPEFRKPFARPLPPITDDIFSQQVDNDTQDQYEEDSFCMADSFVENDSNFDTLDLLDRKAEDIRRNRKKDYYGENDKKRKRIIAAGSSDDESLIKTKNESPDRVLKKSKRVISLVSSDEDSSSNEQSDSNDVAKEKEAPAVTAPNDFDWSNDYMSESMIEAKKMAVIVSNSEVNRANDLISNLRLVLGLNVIVPKKTVDYVTFVTGSCGGAIRIAEANFNNGAKKDKLIKSVTEARHCYRDLSLIIELEKAKPGDRPKTGRRTKQLDMTLSQVMLSGTRVFYSNSEAETASIVAKLVERAVQSGEGLPRQLFSDGQEKMVDFLIDLPSVGLGTAYQLAVNFTTLRELINSSKATIMSKGIPEFVAAGMIRSFHKRLDPVEYEKRVFGFIE